MQISSINNFNFKASVKWLTPETIYDLNAGIEVEDTTTPHEAIKSYDEAIKIVGMQAKQGLIGPRVAKNYINELKCNQDVARRLHEFLTNNESVKCALENAPANAKLEVLNDCTVHELHNGEKVKIQEPRLLYLDERRGEMQYLKPADEYGSINETDIIRLIYHGGRFNYKASDIRQGRN